MQKDSKPSAGGLTTILAFQRTRLSADRTLMSVIRTALSLIGFGFTIFQFFRKLRETVMVAGGSSPRTFGIALVFLGVGLLSIGIVYHIRFMLGLRQDLRGLIDTEQIRSGSRFPVSYTLIVAILLLLLGFTAIVSMTLNIGPLD